MDTPKSLPLSTPPGSFTFPKSRCNPTQQCSEPRTIRDTRGRARIEIPPQSSRPLDTRYRSPLDLPNELFDQIVAHVEQEDLWYQLGVCRSWRERLISNKLFWRRKLRIDMVEPKFDGRGLKRLAHLAGSSFDALEIRTAATNTSNDILSCLQSYCPDLKSLDLRWHMFDKAILRALVNKDALRTLVLSETDDMQATDFSEAMRLFPRLQNVQLAWLSLPYRNPYDWDELDPDWFDWGPPDCLPALKSLELVAAPEYRRKWGAELAMMNMRSFTMAAPNLERMVVNGLRVGQPDVLWEGGVWPITSYLDLRGFSRLKELKIADSAFELDFFPPLPPSLETLTLSVSTVEKLREALLECDDLPMLPKLKSLTTNMDAHTDRPGESMWFNILSKSNCLLTELDITQVTHVPDPTMSYWASTWSSELCAKLLQTPCLSEVQALGINGSWMTTDLNMHNRLAAAITLKCPRLRDFMWVGTCCIDIRTAADLIQKPGVPLNRLMITQGAHLSELAGLGKSRGVRMYGFGNDAV